MDRYSTDMKENRERKKRRWMLRSSLVSELQVVQMEFVKRSGERWRKRSFNRPHETVRGWVDSFSLSMVNGRKGLCNTHVSDADHVMAHTIGFLRLSPVSRPANCL